MTDPNTPAPDGQQPADPPTYSAPAADPVYSAPPADATYAPPAAPAYGENAYAAPAYNAAPQYNGGYQAPIAVPGRTMGIVALVLAIIPGTQLIGLILGIVALVQSRKAGQKNGVALAAIIVSAVLIVIGIIIAIALFSWIAGQGTDLLNQVAQCEQDPSGSIIFNGVTIPCQEFLDQYNR